MATNQTQSPDTSYAAERILFDRYRTMSAAEKLVISTRLWTAAQELALAGMRRRHPNASESDLKMLVAATWLDAATLRNAFGWP